MLLVAVPIVVLCTAYCCAYEHTVMHPVVPNAVPMERQRIFLYG